MTTTGPLDTELTLKRVIVAANIIAIVIYLSNVIHIDTNILFACNFLSLFLLMLL